MSMNGLVPRLPVSGIVAHLVDAGEGIATALTDLAADPGLVRADECIARLQSASDAVQRLRRLLAEGESREGSQ